MGRGTPVAFRHELRDLACVVHRDDFTFSCCDEDCERIMFFCVLLKAENNPRLLMKRRIWYVHM